MERHSSQFPQRPQTTTDFPYILLLGLQGTETDVFVNGLANLTKAMTEDEWKTGREITGVDKGSAGDRH